MQEWKRIYMEQKEETTSKDKEQKMGIESQTCENAIELKSIYLFVRFFQFLITPSL